MFTLVFAERRMLLYDFECSDHILLWRREVVCIVVHKMRVLVTILVPLLQFGICADTRAMSMSSPQLLREVVDIPPEIRCERRRAPDRRVVWRGGRRDADWLDRPSGAWERFEATRRWTPSWAWRLVPVLKPQSVMRLSPFAVAVLALQASAIGCSGGPAGPDPILPLQAGGVATLPVYSPPASVSTFPLIEGSFRLTFTSGDYISGTYTGSALVSNPGRDIAVLNFVVTKGFGVFAGATGTLTGDGGGAYAGEGNFLLAMKGLVSTKFEPTPFAVQANIHGTAVASCETEHIVMALAGDGNVPRFGGVTATFRHEVGSASCEQ
jgi:hypothetical protein